MAYKINEEVCVGCGACETVCPTECISERDSSKRRIDGASCVSCGACAGICPVACIAPEK